MDSEEKKIAKVLKEIGFSHLLQYFIDEEFTFESFRLLTIEFVKDFLPKAGPRTLFWSRYTKYFQNEQRNKKGIPAIPSVAYESDSDGNSLGGDSFDPLSDPLNDNENEVFTIELPTSTQIVKDEPRVLDDNFFKSLMEIATPSPASETRENHPKPQASTSFAARSEPPQEVEPRQGSIKEYLNTAQGSLLYNKYKKSHALEDRDRGLLARIVIYKEYESLGLTVEQKFKLSAQRFMQISEEISQIFPNEKPEAYYVPYNTTTKAVCSGKLWHAFNGFKKQLKMSRELSPSVDADLPDSPANEVSAAIATLSSSSNWEDIKNSWNITRSYRRHFLSNPDNSLDSYYEKFPILKSSGSYRLLILDFNALYPDAADKFTAKWTDLNGKLLQVGRSKINKSEFTKIDEDSPFELSGFLLLPHLLPNAYLPKSDKKKRVRLSRNEIEQYLVLFIQEGSDVATVVRKENKKYAEQGIPMCPRLIYVGRSYLKVSAAYVEVNMTLYKMESPLAAIDAYVKIVLALNTNYACGAKPIWTFLQQYIYEIKSERDAVYTSVNVLLSEIEAFK